MISTLILDLDGPLLEGKERHYRCYSDILKKHGHLPLPMEQYWESKRNACGGRELLSLSNAAELFDTFSAEWLERIEMREYLRLDSLQPGVLDILSGWKKSGLILWLVTMRHHAENLHWQLQRTGMREFLDRVMVTGGLTGKAAAVREVLDDKQQLFWIGDTEADIEAARESGIRVCALSCGLRTAEYLAGHAPDRLDVNLQAFASWFNPVGRTPHSW